MCIRDRNRHICGAIARYRATTPWAGGLVAGEERWCLDTQTAAGSAHDDAQLVGAAEILAPRVDELEQRRAVCQRLEAELVDAAGANEMRRVRVGMVGHRTRLQHRFLRGLDLPGVAGRGVALERDDELVAAVQGDALAVLG